MQRDVVERLGELLREVGFDSHPYDTLRNVSGGVPPAAALAAFDRTEEVRLATLAALFATGRTVSHLEAKAAVRPLALDDLVSSGLVESDGSAVRARVSLFPFGGLIVVGDPPGERTSPEFVPHVSPATKILASLVRRTPTRAVLDLGTGSGALAMLAARHAEQVTGIDINPRALSHAHLGQRLNKVDNVSWVEGDWLEPVHGQRFELVMVNPPYAISPDQTFVYRESSAAGDELSRQLVRDSADHIAEGGLAVVGCNWAHPRDAWEGPLREWVAELGCDALLLHFDSQDPVAYAMTWHNQARRSGPKLDEAVTRWAEHHRRIRVDRVGWGAIILRRRAAGPNWTRAFHIRGGPNGPGGDQLARVFAGCDFLESQTVADQFRLLLSTPWRLVEGHRLDQVLRYEDGAYTSGQAVLRQEPGLTLSAPIDMRVVQVVSACNGQWPLGELLAQVPLPEALDQRSFQSLCLDAVRFLIATGFLVGEPLET